MRFSFALLPLALAGCLTHYERVAKDWALAIRASQVIPVYPLTEDLRPGDVFLVQRPISRQVDEYNSRGFLSLDDHRTRLEGLDYKLVYHDGYFKDEFGETPNPRPKRPPGSAGPVEGENAIVELTEAKAPRAAFPAYNFSLDRGAGLSLAIPIQGVPVALSFMGTQSATGTVLIGDARTYAADSTQLFEKLREWSGRSKVKEQLVAAFKSVGGPVYLRVVKRVYLTGGVNVSITNEDRVATNVRAGLVSDQASDPEINVETFKGQLEKQNDVLDALTRFATAQGVGGSVSFNQASRRSVSLSEAFDVPLVIGYLGMDVPVFEDGSLGMPLATFERLEGKLVSRPTRLADLSASQEEIVQRVLMVRALVHEPEQSDASRALTIIDTVARDIGYDQFPGLTAEEVREATALEDEEGLLSKAREIFLKFQTGLNVWLAAEGRSGPRHDRANDLLKRATGEE